MPRSNISSDTLSIAITGAGGKGVISAGLILLNAAARVGRYALMGRSVGPQIRGGEATALLRISNNPVACHDDYLDLLIALDWKNTGRFADELPLDTNSLLIFDPKAGEPPEQLLATHPQRLPLPLEELSKELGEGRSNMLAVGIAGALLGLPEAALDEASRDILADKDEDVIDIAIASLRLGRKVVANEPSLGPEICREPSVPRWNISGNEACGLGALRAGVRFAAAYPITPASELLEWLSPRLEQLGGNLIQAEDELAAINMAIGAAFGGVPAMTATSGPGLSLMQEGIGLAIASETPLLLINVNRGGPSTGIPTKSEQSDLYSTLYGPHGDAPHLVLAPLSIADCVFTTAWAASLAEKLQTVAIVLSEQSLGQSRVVCAPPVDAPNYQRDEAQPASSPFRRYLLTESGVSPIAYPGASGLAYVADGLEHDSKGTPSSAASDHLAQLDKRRRKLTRFNYGNHWGEVEGEGALCLISFGSLTAVLNEAAERLRATGQGVRTIALRLLAPLPITALCDALADTSRVVVVEQNQQGQLFHYLCSEQVLTTRAQSIARPGPLPLRPGELVQILLDQRA